ncbi:hypothetical protein FHW69_001661 [Luteibacter sp. Sphag1AF]|uniref:FHA domain-containing protein n=1 Tax=Luteibacter sp. Sphag1AF TaxID=2587031 RepID=UPI00160751DC|nr:FHA domain-containing protein [Luteibacter sp. Sphag1AF]MBB3227060.1 hypothetical protein [Luteibacter sp. Sphag1AF]
MRIEFVSSARGDFHWSQPVLRLGRADGNDLVVAEPQVAAHHVSILKDRRGLTLEVAPSVGRVYVNARPVRERALLRAGDSLSIGDCRMLIRDDDDIEQRELIPATDAHCTVALRPVAGPLSGRTLPVGDRLELGAPHSAWPLELPQGDAAVLSIYWHDGALRLDGSRVPARHALRLNGVRVVQASLQPGDQIGVGAHRFVLDGPGWSAEPVIVPAPAPEPEVLPEDAAGPRGEVWWLILTAALLALGIAVVLFVHF